MNIYIKLKFNFSGTGWTLSSPNNNGVGAPASGPSSATQFLQSQGTGAYFDVRIY